MLVRVKRFKRDFPLHQVNSAILQAVRTLGNDRPTEDQRDAIGSFVEGVDVLVSLPTGSACAMHAFLFYLMFFGVMSISKGL